MEEEFYLLNSINIKRCQNTNQKLLKKLEQKLCLNCKEIPIPPYRIISNQKQYFCKNCLIKNNVKNDSIIEPTTEEIDLLVDIEISCKFEGCYKIFKMNDLNNLKSHEKNCLSNHSDKVNGCINCFNCKTNLDFLNKNFSSKLEFFQKKYELIEKFLKEFFKIKENIEIFDLNFNDLLEEKLKKKDDLRQLDNEKLCERIKILEK